jgi:hypothetical protein
MDDDEIIKACYEIQKVPVELRELRKIVKQLADQRSCPSVRGPLPNTTLADFL